MSTDTLVYGVRGPDPRNTVVKAPSAREAVEMRAFNDVVVVSHDGGRTWQAGRVRIVRGEVRNYETAVCDDCGKGLMLPGWLCQDCWTDRGMH